MQAWRHVKLERVNKKNDSVAGLIKPAIKQYRAVLLLLVASTHSHEETPVGPAFTDAWNVWDSMGRAPGAERQGFDGCSSARLSARAVKSAQRK